LGQKGISKEWHRKLLVFVILGCVWGGVVLSIVTLLFLLLLVLQFCTIRTTKPVSDTLVTRDQMVDGIGWDGMCHLSDFLFQNILSFFLSKSFLEKLFNVVRCEVRCASSFRCMLDDMPCSISPMLGACRTNTTCERTEKKNIL
jgi:hypothetical protein